MKTKTFLLLGVTLLCTTTFTFAQSEQEEEQRDSSKKEYSFDLTIGKEDRDNQKESNGKEITYPRVYGGITFSRIDWGFSRLSDDGSFTLSEENQFLAYKKASNFGFDVAQFGLRFNDNFKVYLAAGFEWNYWRLKQNILLNENSSPLDYIELDPAANYKKNVLTSTYMRMPITFELRSRKLRSGERVKLAFGAMTGILLKGTQRLKSEQNGKQKFKDTYNFQTFQFGPFVRIGYDDFGIFAKYYVNDLFEKSPEQKGLRNVAFGLTLGF